VTIPQPPPTGPLAWLQLKLASRLTRVILIWSAIAIAIVAIFFGIVATSGSLAEAYDLLTLHESPIGSRAGAAGLVLGTLGYLLVPAIIGAIVSAIFTKTMRISRADYQRGLSQLAKEVSDHTNANKPASAQTGPVHGEPDAQVRDSKTGLQ